MIPLLQQASVIISRAGAGTVIELISLGKPSIFIPLKMAQKNEQFHNAMEANKKLGSLVIAENELSKDRLLEAIHNVKSLPLKDPVNENPTETILNLIKTI